MGNFWLDKDKTKQEFGSFYVESNLTTSGSLFVAQPHDPTITFCTDKEMLRMEPDGKFFVQGRLVETDKEVFDAFVRFLNGAGVLNRQ